MARPPIEGMAMMLVLAAGLAGMPRSSVAADPDRPLVFELGTGGAASSCLIALNHLVVRRAEESAAVVACEKRARSLLVEAAPEGKNGFSWARYERKGAGLAFRDLNPAIRERIVPALRAAQYSPRDIDYLLQLQPVAIYRALTYSKALATDVKLVPNIDAGLLTAARQKQFMIREMEGIDGYFEHEGRMTADQLDQMIGAMCDVFLEPGRLERTRKLAQQYLEDLSVQPDIDTAWNKKFWFNTVALGLPGYTVAQDVDGRNAGMAAAILKAMAADGSVLILVGAAHVGGPEGLIKLLSRAGIAVKRLQ